MKKTTFFAILLAMILGAIYYQLTQTKQEGLAVEPSDEENQPANDEQSPNATGNEAPEEGAQTVAPQQ